VINVVTDRTEPRGFASSSLDSSGSFRYLQGSLTVQGPGVARAKVIDFDYYQFIGLLRRAGDAGKRIERGDAGWAEYIQSHGINEIAATAIARQKFESPAAVILNEGKGTDGLYFYSKNEEACLRLVPLGD
jgi:hypothetical protein